MQIKQLNLLLAKMKRKRRILIVIILFGICIFAYRMYVESIISMGETIKLYRLPTILLWNSKMSHKRWELSADTLTPSHFRKELNCPVYQCVMSINHKYLSSIDSYDAIVFWTARVFPKSQTIPFKRSSNQLYIFANRESPPYTFHDFRNEKSFYNLTMTYRVDSDILWSYGAIADIKTGAVIAPSIYPDWRLPPTSWNDSVIWELWPQKTNDVAWFVSRCNAASKREKLTKALQQYINIDIFGECGSKRCPHSTACDEMLDKKYKFYLSFENSLCTDYVTEKFYRALNHSIIPVVFGGADYKGFAPPHSYINAENFETVDALASYMKYIASNVTEYMRFFWWRRYYKSIRPPSPFCDLCALLHSQNYQEKNQTYDDIDLWFTDKKCRVKSNIKYYSLSSL